MIVLDASVTVELILRTGRADRIAARAFGPEQSIHAPHLIDIEVAHVLRRLVLAKEISATRAGEALDYFRLFDLQRHAHEGFVPRIWELRAALSAYDAAYIALAEALAAPLLTCDERLSRSHGHTAKIELIGTTQ